MFLSHQRVFIFSLHFIISNTPKNSLSKRASKAQGEYDNLDKAEQRHAEKQVQVTADGADQRVQSHLGLLLDLRHRERLVVEHEASQVVACVSVVVKRKGKVNV